MFGAFTKSEVISDSDVAVSVEESDESLSSLDDSESLSASDDDDNDGSSFFFEIFATFRRKRRSSFDDSFATTERTRFSSRVLLVGLFLSRYLFDAFATAIFRFRGLEGLYNHGIFLAASL
jgi:hypothetical protein